MNLMGKQIGLAFFVLLSISASAQLRKQLETVASMKPSIDIVCYNKPEDQNTIVQPPQAYQTWKLNKNTRTNSTTFEVTYQGFSPEAQLAFQKAVDIWSSLIETEIPIRILAVWRPITDGSGSTNTILGGANPGTFIRDFDGAQRTLTWYPVALAEKMAKKEFNAVDDPDIFAQFNSAFNNWYVGTDGVPQSGKTDLTTVVLHEIGHGLGITKGYNVNGNLGEISDSFSALHVIYDLFIENDLNKNLSQNFVPPSASLKTELTTAPLWYRTPQLEKISGGADNRVQLYAPTIYQSGSSIAHLDETSYDGTINALMTPQIGNAEVHHDPGPLVMKMLADMGWVHTQIAHERLKNIEDVATPFEVKVKMIADNLNGYNYNAGEVKLNYTTGGTTFTTLPMTTTGVANEFAATIPAAGSPINYGYYISVKDNLNRTLTRPGTYTQDGKAPEQRYFTFQTGPDTETPEISHSPKGFLIETDTELKVEASVTDNLGIKEVVLTYLINTVAQPPTTLPANADGSPIYTFTIPLSGLVVNDEISYRISARDLSVIGTPGGNLAYSPSLTEYHTIPVVGLAPTQDSYANNFNVGSSDFFGNGFSIIQPNGFNDGAIHSNHPYPEGNTFPGQHVELIYQLKIPIRVKAADATLVFDEIVLVEPGDIGATFPSEDFFDYVVVEGSKDGGVTWTTLADGYDSRSNAAWLNLFNSSITGNNSTAAGNPSLFFKRSLNLLNKFSEGDEVVIRFKLLSDPLANGWGWAIDNLKIQVDETPPTILHDHFDYLKLSSPTLPITIKVKDNSGVDKLFVDYKVNKGELNSKELPISDEISQYTLDLSFIGLAANDLIEYQIRASDKAGNEGTLPANAFFEVPAINFGTPISQYVSDFNSPNSDFVGNFFSISQPAGFTSGAIQSDHFYLNGFGLTSSLSNYCYTLVKPVTISSTNPFMLFSEVALVEYASANNKDFVVVEGSKDNGATWESFVDAYSSLSNSNWKNTYDAGGSGSTLLYKTHLINLTSSGKFIAGDNVLIRFRLSADGEKNGWGWAIDNLSIQGPITGIEPSLDGISMSVYPNPATTGKLVVEIQSAFAVTDARIQIINSQGRGLINQSIEIGRDKVEVEYTINDWADGLYFVRLIKSDGTFLTKKFIKTSK